MVSWRRSACLPHVRHARGRERGSRVDATRRTRGRRQGTRVGCALVGPPESRGDYPLVSWHKVVDRVEKAGRATRVGAEGTIGEQVAQRRERRAVFSPLGCVRVHFEPRKDVVFHPVQPVVWVRDGSPTRVHILSKLLSSGIISIIIIIIIIIITRAPLRMWPGHSISRQA